MHEPFHASRSDEQESMSDSDWDMENERLRNINVTRCILADLQFNKAKVLLRQYKLELLNAKRKSISEHNSTDLLCKMRLLQEKNRHNNMVNNTRRSLEYDALSREIAGTSTLTLEDAHKGNLKLSKLRETLEKRKTNLEYRRQNSMVVLAQLLLSDTQYNIREHCPTVDYEFLDKMSRTFGRPIIVHQLKDEEIQEDLRFFDNAIAEADIRRGELEIAMESEVDAETLVASGSASASNSSEKLPEEQPAEEDISDFPFEDNEPSIASSERERESSCMSTEDFSSEIGQFRIANRSNLKTVMVKE